MKTNQKGFTLIELLGEISDGVYCVDDIIV